MASFDTPPPAVKRNRLTSTRDSQPYSRPSESSFCKDRHRSVVTCGAPVGADSSTSKASPQSAT